MVVSCCKKVRIADDNDDNDFLVVLSWFHLFPVVIVTALGQIISPNLYRLLSKDSIALLTAVARRADAFYLLRCTSLVLIFGCQASVEFNHLAVFAQAHSNMETKAAIVRSQFNRMESDHGFLPLLHPSSRSTIPSAAATARL